VKRQNGTQRVAFSRELAREQKLIAEQFEAFERKAIE
jgi:hypothetical protein